ncbi:hypothetical protein ABW20_dc0102179 [Dactylellina cionopaga]|nr:hypothetical protein ABW20_dc0102179 [Dactylellina cionopaga]
MRGNTELMYDSEFNGEAPTMASILPSSTELRATFNSAPHGIAKPSAARDRYVSSLQLVDHEVLFEIFVERPSPGLARSFTRLESQNANLPRSRSTTVSSAATTDRPSLFGAFSESNAVYEPIDGLGDSQPDGTAPNNDTRDPSDDAVLESNLPAEIQGLTDSFIESLSARVHPAPVSIESLSAMFQAFYETAASSISTYVSKLYTSYDAQGLDQPLVSMSEIVQRKKDRKKRDIHRVILQDLVEKKVTEAVFDKIWRHYNAEDEARDEALRSKTMALAVVGIGLKELGLEENINVMDLQPVCEALESLNHLKCPQDKLKLLKKAHKGIVDVLTKLVPTSTSSADHILPILIYSLIISPPQIHIISNLLYIQRFRYHKAVDGEAAYCLTNLEAAISFLETVDMSTLTTDEPRPEVNPQLESIGTGPILLPYLPDATDNASGQKGNVALPSSAGPARLISYLTPVEFAASAATSAVNTADQSLKTIGNSLENSYKFLFGKLSDKRTELPKTLEDVRKLVGTPSQEGEALREPMGDELLRPQKVKGESMRRIESSDSTRSKNSAVESTVPSNLETNMTMHPLQSSSEIQPNSSGITYTPVADSVRNLGSQLGRFAGNINVIRTFSKNQITKTTEVGSSNISTSRPNPDVTTIDPPIQRYLETAANDLKIGDVELLLQDYRRLALTLRNLGAF